MWRLKASDSLSTESLVESGSRVMEVSRESRKSRETPFFVSVDVFDDVLSHGAIRFVDDGGGNRAILDIHCALCPNAIEPNV